jgi:signal transduction histidine kinase
MWCHIKLRKDANAVPEANPITRHKQKKGVGIKLPGLSTGLSLYSVQEIMTAHQALISVASEAGQGTTFTITLPATMPSDTVEL